MLKAGLLLAAATILVQGAFAGNFLPLQQGNSWTYRDRVTGQQFTVRVGTPVLINEREYYSLSGYVEQRVLARVEGDHLLVVDEESGREMILTSFEPSDTAWWDAHQRVCEAQGQSQLQRTIHDGPVGPVPAALEIRYRNFGCADTGVESEQYAENLGMLRRTVQTFAGPRTFDLASAHVGHVRIEPAPRGSFSVSHETKVDDSIAVTLRIETDPAETITLPFASGQEYDIAVRNDQDEVVYLWSSTALFVQLVHDVKVEGEWTRTVTIPRPGPGRYTVHAWMTTSGGAPRFAATVPLTVAER